MPSTMLCKKNFAIQYNKEYQSRLVITPRKRVIKNSLLVVNKGLVLIKLKKYEYAVSAKEAFWLPFDCLTSLTLFPETELSRVDFSVRLNDDFPKQAGYVSLPQVSHAIISKLNSEECSDIHTQTLLQVIREEARQLEPNLPLSSLSQQFNDWKPDATSELSQEIQLSLKVREARKQVLSGTNRQKVIDQLFSGSSEKFSQISELLLGKAL